MLGLTYDEFKNHDRRKPDIYSATASRIWFKFITESYYFKHISNIRHKASNAYIYQGRIARAFTESKIDIKLGIVANKNMRQFLRKKRPSF